MEKNKYWLMLAVAALVLGVLACSFSASTAGIENAWMARDYDGQQPTTVFAQDEVFYCVVDLVNAPEDTTVKASWSVVEAEGVEPNYPLDEAELTSGDADLHFELSNNMLWPVGKYKVDLYLNAELDQTLEFEVR